MPEIGEDGGPRVGDDRHPVGAAESERDDRDVGHDGSSDERSGAPDHGAELEGGGLHVAEPDDLPVAMAVGLVLSRPDLAAARRAPIGRSPSCRRRSPSRVRAASFPTCGTSVIPSSVPTSGAGRGPVRSPSHRCTATRSPSWFVTVSGRRPGRAGRRRRSSPARPATNRGRARADLPPVGIGLRRLAAMGRRRGRLRPRRWWADKGAFVASLQFDRQGSGREPEVLGREHRLQRPGRVQRVRTGLDRRRWSGRRREAFRRAIELRYTDVEGPGSTTPSRRTVGPDARRAPALILGRSAQVGRRFADLVDHDSFGAPFGPAGVARDEPVRSTISTGGGRLAAALVPVLARVPTGWASRSGTARRCPARRRDELGPLGVLESRHGGRARSPSAVVGGSRVLLD